jgi:hypothetical protein
MARDYENSTDWILPRYGFDQAGIEADLQAQNLWYILTDISSNTFKITTRKEDDKKVEKIVWDPKNTPK